MKLTVRKVWWLIRRKEEGMSNREIVWALKVSKRRVKHVLKMYRDTGNIPIIRELLGRPRTSVVTEKERQIIKEAKKLYKLGARRLEPIIERDYKYHIPHNKIHNSRGRFS
jgi:putative transposase